MLQETIFALSDPTRREIIKLLRRGGRTAGQIAERFDLSPPAISRHLRILREAELIESERCGKFLLYRLCTEPLGDLADWLLSFSEDADNAL